jgi:hypothetical protein
LRIIYLCFLELGRPLSDDEIKLPLKLPCQKEEDTFEELSSDGNTPIFN